MLAEKRKKLLDELAVEKQKDLESHKEQLEKVKGELEEKVTELESYLVGEEKLRREVSQANERFELLQQKFDSVQNKSGWLERTLKETEELLESERQNHVSSVENLKSEHKSKIEEEHATYAAEKQSIIDEKTEVERERDEQKLIVEKLKQASKDKEVEYRISNKKGDGMLKDLKRQLKMERKRADQLQQRLQDFLTETKVKQSFDELFASDSPQMKGHRRTDSGSHLSTVSSSSGMGNSGDADTNKTSSPVVSRAIDTTQVNDETMDLIAKVADLQQEKWVLEEKVRHLEENGSVLAEDLMQKTAIIQNFVMDTKGGLVPEKARGRSHTLKDTLKEKMMDKLNKPDERLKEMNTKLQTMLEETLTKNIQLQKDIDHLTKELERLSASHTSEKS